MKLVSFDTMDNKLLSPAMMISLSIHLLLIILLSLPYFRRPVYSKPFHSLELTYQSVKHVQQKKKEVAAKKFKVIRKQSPNPVKKVDVLAKDGSMFSAINNQLVDLSKLEGQLSGGRKKSPQISTLDISRKITLPPLSTEKITNPKYLTYNDDMRAAISRNIKRRAYTYVNHPEFEAGKVYLTFVLASNGSLKQVQVIDHKTFANKYLRKVALKSIRESSPFPPFPIGFNYPEFTFNLLISFQE